MFIWKGTLTSTDWLTDWQAWRLACWVNKCVSHWWRVWVSKYFLVEIARVFFFSFLTFFNFFLAVLHSEKLVLIKMDDEEEKETWKNSKDICQF